MSYSLKEIDYLNNLFKRIATLQELAECLKVEPHLLQLLAISPRYKSYHIKKKNGKTRLIEDPELHLKQVQKQLNRFLQCVYFLQRTPAAYGFQIAVKNQTDERNIVSNALRHRHDSFMLKVDFQDFFHQISFENVRLLYQSILPEADESCIHILSSLCCYKERLPMGAPTSPVLSNLFTIKFDHDLLDLARQRLWTYTRFADDLIFSGKEPFSPQDFVEIQSIAQVHDLYFNAEKTTFLHNQSEKIITGILLTQHGVSVPKPFFDETVAEIHKLKNIIEVQCRNGLPETEWIENYKAEIIGQINFVAYVLGKNAPEVIRLNQLYADAVEIESKSYSEPVSWINLAYLS